MTHQERQWACEVAERSRRVIRLRAELHAAEDALQSAIDRLEGACSEASRREALAAVSQV